MEAGVKVDTNPDSDGRYHSNWLNMIYPRLLLARQLLKDDGVIFVSIDDNEAHNLRKVMDEVFGEECFISSTIIQANKRGQTYKDIAKTHEYLLIYGKEPSVPLFELDKEGGALPYEDSIGSFDLWELRNRNPKFGRHNRPNLYYPVYVSSSETDENGYCKVALEKSTLYNIEVFPLNSDGEESCWRWGKGKFILNNQNAVPVIVAKQKKNDGWNIYEKSRKSTTKPKSIWTDSEVTIWDETAVISEQGTTALGKLGLSSIFDFPKPVELIKKCLKISIDEDGYLLDFFAGSGVSAQAACEFNLEFKENLRFILVQLPEQTKADSEAYKAGFKKISDITIERVKRVINGYGDNPQPLNAGFKGV